jgi:mono/diheme cytochrome c family protein
MKSFLIRVVVGVIGAGFLLQSLAVAQTVKMPDPKLIPKDYQGKTMPAGWWTDPNIVEEGKKIYTGMVNMMANCSACHGPDGKPVLPEARDLRDAAYVAKITEAYWFWRVSVGVTGTPMQGFKGILKEDQIWKVIAYEHTLSHAGKPAVHQH